MKFTHKKTKTKKTTISGPGVTYDEERSCMWRDESAGDVRNSPEKNSECRGNKFHQNQKKKKKTRNNVVLHLILIETKDQEYNR